MSRSWIGVLVFVLCSLPAGLAQREQATIVGTVSDATGAVVPGAAVSVQNLQTGVVVESEANSAGQYRVPYLQPGRYELSAESAGFNTSKVSDIVLSVGLTATVNVVLAVGSVETEVTVAATAVQLEVQSSTLGNVVDSNQILNLPLLGRDPYSLVALAPGVIPKRNSSSGVNPVINGGRSNTSGVLLDGAESRNATTQNIAYTPPLETVQEFKLLTNNFSAEYGRTGGGVLTAATRSGTNDLHGSAYWFIRNDKLNANSWQNNRVGLSRSPFRRNEYGFSLGGPVVIPSVYDGRNKTFFFANWEEALQRSPDDIQGTVPTALERMGDFSETTTGGSPIRVFDPMTTRANPDNPGQYIRDPFPGNVIPEARFDPVATNVLDFFPTPNRSTETQNFVMNQSRQNDNKRLFFRADQNFGSKHRLFFSHGRASNPQFTPGINIAYPNEGTNGNRGQREFQNRMASLSHTVTFSPSVIGQFRATYARREHSAQPRSVGYDFTELGISQEVLGATTTPMFPRFQIADVDALGPQRAGFYTEISGNTGAQGHLTWVQGNHSLKTGAEYGFYYNNLTRPEQPNGRYDFNRAFTQGPNPAAGSSSAGFGVASFLLGAPSGGTISNDPSLAASMHFYSWYVQDDWRVLPNLTFNLGVRWEYQAPWTERYDQLAFFDPEATDPLTGQLGVLQFVGQDGLPRHQTRPDKNNIAPRVGLAWRITKDTVVRTGYGIFFYPGGGGIGAGVGDMGSGWAVQTPVFLGQAPDAPNTPPLGASVANAFQGGFFTPPSTLVGSGISTQWPEWVTPFNQQWNFSLQRMMPGRFLVEAAYAGSRGQQIWINRNRTSVSADHLSLGSGLDELVPNPYFGIITTGSLSAERVRRSALLQPYNHYTTINRARDPVGDSIYHAFTLRVDRQMTNGLRMQVAYTISKMIDNVPERFARRSDFNDPNNLALSRSIGEWDRPQHLAVNWVYELPFGRGRKWAQEGFANWIAGGWQITGIATFSKGIPMVITGPNNARLPGTLSRTIRQSSGVLPDGQQTLDRWFDTSAFTPAPLYSLGNDSRTQPSLRGPGIKSFDIGLNRNFRMSERFNLQFRAEFFNAFNTPQFNEPNGSVTNRNFGVITSARDNRNIQLGLRLSF